MNTARTRILLVFTLVGLTGIASAASSSFFDTAAPRNLDVSAPRKTCLPPEIAPEAQKCLVEIGADYLEGSMDTETLLLESQRCAGPDWEPFDPRFSSLTFSSYHCEGAPRGC